MLFPLSGRPSLLFVTTLSVPHFCWAAPKLKWHFHPLMSQHTGSLTQVILVLLLWLLESMPKGMRTCASCFVFFFSYLCLMDLVHLCCLPGVCMNKWDDARSLVSCSENQAEQVQKTVRVCVYVCFELLDSISLNRKWFQSDFVRSFIPKKKMGETLKIIFILFFFIFILN